MRRQEEKGKGERERKWVDKRKNKNSNSVKPIKPSGKYSPPLPRYTDILQCMSSCSW